MVKLQILSALVVMTGASVAQAQNAQPATVSSEVARPYTLNPGDEIELYVWGEERLQRVLRILPDGSFSFPLIGRVIAQGKTLKDIEAIVSKGLESQYRGQVPQVTVSVKTPLGLQFSVAGRVVCMPLETAMTPTRADRPAPGARRRRSCSPGIQPAVR